MIFAWSENELLILEKAALCEAFWIFFVKWQSKISRCFPAGELKYSGPFPAVFLNV